MSEKRRRKIIITKHAIETYARRRVDKRPYRVLEAEIRECVEAGLAAGHVFDERPPGFVLYRRRSSAMPPGQRFVQCDPESNYGFILKRNPEEGDIVVTTLTKAGVRK